MEYLKVSVFVLLNVWRFEPWLFECLNHWMLTGFNVEMYESYISLNIWMIEMECLNVGMLEFWNAMILKF